MPEPAAERDKAAFFDSLYRDYLLRDYFAKIVPGACVLSAAAFALSRLTQLLSASPPAALLLAGVSWTAGFAIQEVAERLRVLRQRPPKYENDSDRYALQIKFDEVSSRGQKTRVERYSVIKESTGNTSAAILAGLPIAALGRFSDIARAPGIAAFSCALLLGAAGALMAASHRHTIKEYKYMEDVASKAESSLTTREVTKPAQ